MYFIWSKEYNTIIDKTCGCCKLYFATKEQAEGWILQNKHNWDWCGQANLIIKERCDEYWADRERVRLENGTYYPPVWSEQPWYIERYEDLRVYDHVELDLLDMISFTPTVKKGEADIQQAMKPGKFLKKFFGDILTETEILEWTDKHKERYQTGIELKWARTPDEIEKVYTMESTFESCMQYEVGNTNTWPVHPTRIYGAGDLAVAYITRGDDLLIARALVWEEKNKVGRVYGDGALLRKALADYGIKTQSSTVSYDYFEGAKLLKIALPQATVEREGLAEDRDYVVCPFIDGTVLGLNPHPTDPNLLVLVDENPDEDDIDDSDRVENPCKYTAWSTEGYARTRIHCPSCKRFTYSIISINSKDGEKISYCDSCLEDINYFYCELTYEYYDHKYFTRVQAHSKDYWGIGSIFVCAERAAVVKCAKTATYWLESHTRQVGNEIWGMTAVDTYAFTSGLDFRYYPISERVQHPSFVYITKAQMENLNNEYLFGVDFERKAA